MGHSVSRKGKSPEKEKTGRIHVFYSGRVQGVGFRFAAEEIAQSLNLTGWVKNLPDGRVEVICEGPIPLLEDFLNRIKECHLGPHIKRAELRHEEPTGEFKMFRVEFSY